MLKSAVFENDGRSRFRLSMMYDGDSESNCELTGRLSFASNTIEAELKGSDENTQGLCLEPSENQISVTVCDAN
jgi:hypothetical protein